MGSWRIGFLVFAIVCGVAFWWRFIHLVEHPGRRPKK